MQTLIKLMLSLLNLISIPNKNSLSIEATVEKATPWVLPSSLLRMENLLLVPLHLPAFVRHCPISGSISMVSSQENTQWTFHPVSSPFVPGIYIIQLNVKEVYVLFKWVEWILDLKTGLGIGDGKKRTLFHFPSRPPRLPLAVFIIQLHYKFFLVLYEVQVTPFIKRSISYFNVLLLCENKLSIWI